MPTPNEMVQQQAQANALRQQQESTRQQQAQATANVKNPPGMVDQRAEAIGLLNKVIKEGTDEELDLVIQNAERFGGKINREKVNELRMQWQEARAESLQQQKEYDLSVEMGEQSRRQRQRREGPTALEAKRGRDQRRLNKRLEGHLDQVDIDRIQRGY